MSTREEGPGGRGAQAWPPFIPTLMLKILNPPAEVGGLALKAPGAVVGVTVAAQSWERPPGRATGRCVARACPALGGRLSGHLGVRAASVGEEGARTVGTAGSEGSESEGSSWLESRGSSPSEVGTEPDLRGTG